MKFTNSLSCHFNLTQPSRLRDQESHYGFQAVILFSTHLLCRSRHDLLRTANGRAVPSHQFFGVPTPPEGARCHPVGYKRFQTTI